MKDIDKTYDKYAPGTLYSTERDEFLYPEKEGKTESETEKGGVVCNAKFVRVRSTPKIDSDNVVTRVPEGTDVRILEKLPNFYKVSLPGYHDRKLYISSSFVKEV